MTKTIDGLLDCESSAIVNNVPCFETEDFRNPHPSCGGNYIQRLFIALAFRHEFFNLLRRRSWNVLLVLDYLGKSEVFAIPFQTVDWLARFRVFNGTDELEVEPHIVV